MSQEWRKPENERNFREGCIREPCFREGCIRVPCEPPEEEAGNGLLNALIAYWPGNEVNGNALDAHTNALHLTDTNTVTSNPGVVYPLSRQYTLANVEHHRRLADEAILSTGDVDFTLASWCYMDSKPAAVMQIAGKFILAAGMREYRLSWSNATDRLVFTVSSDGAASSAVAANIFGVPALGTWMLVVGWHDSIANTINIQVNDGIADSAAHATGVFDGGACFAVGAGRLAGGAGIAPWDGRIGPTMFWKSAAGGGGVLTAAQRTALYNAGAGLTYAQLTA